jgi:hypothetical protein
MSAPAPRRIPRAPARRSPFLALLASLALVAAAFSACASAVTIGQNVIVLSEPDDYHARQRMEIHEAIHQRQYRERGTLPMIFAYLGSTSRRLAMEAEAYAAELCYLRRVGDRRQAAWSEGFTLALRGYAWSGRVSRAQAEAQLERAYAGGAACETLLLRAGRGWVLAAYPAAPP